MHIEDIKRIMDMLIETRTAKSTCLRRQVGAAVITEDGIISRGYNHSIKEPCTSCLRQRLNVPSGQRSELCYAIHAEEDALIRASKTIIDIGKCSLVCTNFPCSHCAKTIVANGIKKVYYKEDYDDDLAKEILRNVECIQI